MAAYRPDIPPHVAEVIRHLPPDIKRSVKQALRSLSDDPIAGVPLMRELSGLWKYKVRRFRIIYELERKARNLRCRLPARSLREVGRPIAPSRAEEIAGPLESIVEQSKSGPGPPKVFALVDRIDPPIRSHLHFAVPENPKRL
jgi:mRNA interferase RelE/StbE